MRRTGKLKKTIGILLTILFLLLNYSPLVQNIKNFPSEMQIFEGDSQVINFKLPFKVSIEGDNVHVLKLNGNSLKDVKVHNMKEPISIETVEKGDVSLNFKLFGFIPIKRMKINVTPEKKLIPGGNSIGVSMHTRGALVVGTSEVTDSNNVTHFPSMDAGIMPGDIIERVNGVEVTDANHLSRLINKLGGSEAELECRRENNLFTTKIRPVKDENDSKYRLGLWVRDSTAGVGTLTFYDPKTKNFGALGHAITDVDTGSILSVKDGKVMLSEIIDVKIGKKGAPGELIGNFSTKKNVIGNIIKNTKYGIYGKITKKPDFYMDKAIPIAYQQNVKPGKATILATIDDTGVREFDIKILNVNQQKSQSSKGMVIEVTDSELLEKTGGIVQGMSGSPIIQDGKLVGAITHVFVNDPKKGYGIFIEWMLVEANKIID